MYSFLLTIENSIIIIITKTQKKWRENFFSSENFIEHLEKFKKFKLAYCF